MRGDVPQDASIPPGSGSNSYTMQLHASCAALHGAGVLLLGAAGSGKSDLLLRLLDHGFSLVADDRVELDNGTVSAPAALAGLIEVRGLGIMRIPYATTARLALAVELGRGERLPEPEQRYGVPLVRIDPAMASAPSRVGAALRCALGETELLVGALA